VSPLLIAFFSEVEGYCELPPTLYFDMFVDLFFMVEVVIRFLTAIDDDTSYISSLVLVFKAYVRGQLFVDVISAAPISFAEWSLAPNMTWLIAPNVTILSRAIAN
jgi:hypothetical protein